MVKYKLITIALTSAILAGGASLSYAGTLNDEKIPANDVIPISAPINEEVSTISIETKFTDIQNHWAFDKITAMESKGLWEDLADEFEPNKKITSTEFNKNLDLIFNFEDELNFEFIPEQEITRIQVAKAIEKSFAVKKLSVMMTMMFPMYDDTTDLEEGGNSALSFVFNTGIMKGRTAQIFSPNDPITRAEFAVVLNRTLTVLEIAEPIEEPTTDNDDSIENDFDDTDIDELEID